MSDTDPRPHTNVYQNSVIGATVNPVIPDPDAINEAFATTANCHRFPAHSVVRK